MANEEPYMHVQIDGRQIDLLPYARILPCLLR